MSTKLNLLRDLRNNAVKAMRDLHEAAEKESRGFSADELQAFNTPSPPWTTSRPA